MRWPSLSPTDWFKEVPRSPSSAGAQRERAKRAGTNRGASRHALLHCKWPLSGVKRTAQTCPVS